MAKHTESSPNGEAKAESVATPFRRLLVAIDDSPAGEAAVDLVAEWVDGLGALVRFVQVTEEHRQPRRTAGAGTPTTHEPAHQLVVGASTLGARNRQLVRGIAEAAEDFGADVIVLGFDRRRLAGHRLAPSLREQVMRGTDVPVLVTPSPQADGKRHHRLAQDDRERADTVHRYVRV